VSFLSLLQKSLSLDELLFRLRCTTTNLSIFPRTLLTIKVPEIRTTGGTTTIVAHCATRAEFLRQVWGTCGPRKHLIWPASEFSFPNLEYKIGSKRSSIHNKQAACLDGKPEASIP